MPLYLINGSAGTGKSTVCKILEEKGFAAYDSDVDGLARWTNIKTGYVHPKSSIKNSDKTPEFLAVHGWNVPRSTVERLSDSAGDKISFLCGALSNEDELFDLFAGIFSLYVDDATLKERLRTRADNDWGNQEHELRQTLDTHHINYDRYKDIGTVVIDATQAPELVANSILSKVHYVFSHFLSKHWICQLD